MEEKEVEGMFRVLERYLLLPLLGMLDAGSLAGRAYDVPQDTHLICNRRITLQ
jgi:hypothetical protein